MGAYISWKILAIIFSIIPALFMLLMMPIPESPRCLLSHETEIAAAKSLQWFRGGVDSSEELAQVSDKTNIIFFTTHTVKVRTFALLKYLENSSFHTCWQAGGKVVTNGSESNFRSRLSQTMRWYLYWYCWLLKVVLSQVHTFADEIVKNSMRNTGIKYGFAPCELLPSLHSCNKLHTSAKPYFLP